MVKFIGEGDISTINLDSFMNQLNSDYSRYLEMAPMMGLYFSKNIVKSTVDGNLDSVVSIVGPEGAYRYNAISNIPIYFDDNISLALDHTEFGTEVSDTTINATIIPHTVTPQVDDYFEVKMVDNIRQLFRIIDVTPSNIGDRSFFRITVVVAEESLEAIQEQVVSESELVTDNNGDFAICDKRKVQILKELNRKLFPFINLITKKYYVGAINTIGFYDFSNYYDKYSVDLFLNRFIELYIPYFKDNFSVMEFGGQFNDSMLDTTPHILAKLFKVNEISANISNMYIERPFDTMEIYSAFHTMNGYNFHDVTFIPTNIEIGEMSVHKVMPFLDLGENPKIPSVLEMLVWIHVNEPDKVNKFIENELLTKPIRLKYDFADLYTIVAALKILNDYYADTIEYSYNTSQSEQINRLPILG